jgi:predicted nucleic acid-binding protein
LIFIDTNVVSETMRRSPDERVLAWIGRHDRELALPTVAIAELAFGIERIAPDNRASRLAAILTEWRLRYAAGIFGLTEEAALECGRVMGEASRRGRGMSTQDGMIAAIAMVNGGRLATRNLRHFEGCGLDLVSPWEG